MFPPGDGGGRDPSVALQKQRTQQNPRQQNQMQGGGFRPPGMARGLNQTQPGRNPMMPRPMGGMGAPPTLGGQVPGLAQRAAMMRNQQMGQQGPPQGPSMQSPMPPAPDQVEPRIAQNLAMRRAKMGF